MVVAKDDGDDGSVLKLWDDGRKRLWVSLDFSLEHHRGRVGEEGIEMRGNLYFMRHSTRNPESIGVMRLTWVMSMVSDDNSTCGGFSLPSSPTIVRKAECSLTLSISE